MIKTAGIYERKVETKVDKVNLVPRTAIEDEVTDLQRDRARNMVFRKTTYNTVKHNMKEHETVRRHVIEVTSI